MDKHEKLEEGEIINTPKTPGFSHPDAMQFEDAKQINQSSPIKEERKEIKTIESTNTNVKELTEIS